MENAARALTMAAGVLIGIMIISFAVYLFTSLGNTSSEIYSKVEQTKIDKFNSQFLKYYRLDTCTAHDIVSIANLAKNSNKYYELEDLPFPVATNEQELKEVITTFNADKYKKELNNLFEEVGLKETGHASEIAADYILKWMKEH